MQPITDTHKIGPALTPASTLGLGCWAYGGAQWGGQEDEHSRAAMEASLDAGITHFDTATGYGGGRSEQVVGGFLAQHGRRDKVCLASKFNLTPKFLEDPEAAVDASLDRLQTDSIELYYIHWPKSDADMRPAMAGLEQARDKGKLQAIGVSNFSVEQMDQARGAGTIDAYQVNYSLLWRYPERDILPYCREHGIAVVTYSSIAQGILTGKFGPETPTFPEGDQRSKVPWFQDDAWPPLHAAVERMKHVAEKAGRPLTHLAIQWVAAQEGIASVLVGARDAEQAKANAAAIQDPAEPALLEELTAISDDAMQHVPDVGNIFGYYP